MSIKTNFLRKKQLILSDPKAKEAIINKAVRAILGGIGSPAWLALMTEFAETQEQLSRLLGSDSSYYNSQADQGRAYIAANGFFGLENNSYSILDSLDSDLPDSGLSVQLWEEPTPIPLHVDTFHVNKHTLTLEGEKLTPEFLLSSVAPFLKAVAELQRVIDQASGRLFSDVTIKSLSQNSPIEIGLGGAAEAIKQIEETIVPWRRKHAKKMAQLIEQEKRAEIKSLQADVLEKQANSIKSQAEAEKALAEALQLKAEGERTTLENEKLRIELQKARIELVLDVLEKVAPNASEAERLAFVVKLLPTVEELTSSQLMPIKQ